MLVVATQATVIAYARQPSQKAFIMSLPLPFSLAYLSVGQPLDITNVAGLLLFLFYNHVVRLLHKRLRLHIIAAIAVATVGYAIMASLLAPRLPKTELFFWGACILVGGVAGAFQVWFKPAAEPGYRTTLPVWGKFLIIASVIFFIILMKKNLQGFMTLFPMVSVVALYEARYCLRTVCRQMTLFVMASLLMMITIRLLQPALGFGLALLPGWIVFLPVILLLTWRQLKRTGA